MIENVNLRTFHYLLLHCEKLEMYDFDFTACVSFIYWKLNKKSVGNSYSEHAMFKK